MSHDPNLADSPFPVQGSLTYASGSALSGPVAMDANGLQVEQTYSLQLELLALEEVPADLLEPLHDHIRMILISPKANLLAPVIRLTPGGRVQLADVNDGFVEELGQGQWGRCLPITKVPGVLPPEVTAHVLLESTAESDVRGHHVQVYVSRRPGSDPNNPADELELAVIRRGQVPSADRPLTPSQAYLAKDAEALDAVTERVLLRPVSMALPHRAALVFPFAWGHAWAKALVLVITVTPTPETPDEPWMATFADCVQDLMDQEAELRLIHGRSQTWAGCLQSLDDLVRSLYWRHALVHIANTTQAALARDLALAAPDTIARSLAWALYDTQEEKPATHLKALHWCVERLAYEQLLEAQQKERLTPEMRMLLLRHTGQLGRQLSTLRTQLAEARHWDDFSQRVRFENRISLEDMSPAARTRAYEWLQQHGTAPAGYDPLASAPERRTALREIPAHQEGEQDK